MIAKISPPSKDLMKTLTYNFRKVDRDQADILLSGQLSADGRLTAKRVFREMTAYIPSGTRTKNIVFHASINPRPDEPLSDDRLRTIAHEYLCRLGYGDQPFIVFKHRDIAREHIHLVSTRVRHNGSKIRDTMEHVRSTRIMRSLEEQFGLLPSRKKEDCFSPCCIALQHRRVSLLRYGKHPTSRMLPKIESGDRNLSLSADTRAKSCED